MKNVMIAGRISQIDELDPANLTVRAIDEDSEETFVFVHLKCAQENASTVDVEGEPYLHLADGKTCEICGEDLVPAV